MKTNNVNATINTTATRAFDAKISFGIIDVEFKGNKIELCIHPVDRDNNKQLVANIEQKLHRYIGEKITAETMQKIIIDISEDAIALVLLR